MLIELSRVERPYAAACHLHVGTDGRDRLLVVIKALLRTTTNGEFEQLRPSIRRMQKAHDTPRSSVRYASDLAPHKPGTEIVLVGHAVRPRAFPDAKPNDVGLAVHGSGLLLEKHLRVHGPRRYERRGQEVVAGQAALSEDTPLRWEHAYGGVCPASGQSHRQNPVGVGFALEPSAREGALCPRIEARGAKSEAPAGFGPIHPTWEPRYGRRGTTGSDWVTTRAPLPPQDRHERYHCVAPDDQWLASPLVGRETFTVTGTERDGMWLFSLPGSRPRVNVASRLTAAIRPHLDTVSLDADKHTVELSYRVLLPNHVSPEMVTIETEDAATFEERHGVADVAALLGLGSPRVETGDQML